MTPKGASLSTCESRAGASTRLQPAEARISTVGPLLGGGVASNEGTRGRGSGDAAAGARHLLDLFQSGLSVAKVRRYLPGSAGMEAVATAARSIAGMAAGADLPEAGPPVRGRPAPRYCPCTLFPSLRRTM